MARVVADVPPDALARAMGILAAVAWLYNPILLALFLLPVVALRVAFTAIKQAEERAVALRRRSEQLEAVLAASRHMRVQHTPADLLQPVVEAARAVTGAATAAGYLRDEDDPVLLTRVVSVPPHAAAGPRNLLAPAPGSGVQEDVEEEGRTLLVPLERDGTGAAGLLLLAGVTDELGDDKRDALATQAAIAQDGHPSRSRGTRRGWRRKSRAPAAAAIPSHC